MLSPVLKFAILRLCTYTIVFINVFQTPIQQIFRFERIYERYVRYVSVIFILSVLTRLIHPCSLPSYLKIIFMFRHRMKPIINDSINATLSARSCVYRPIYNINHHLENYRQNKKFICTFVGVKYRGTLSSI